MAPKLQIINISRISQRKSFIVDNLFSLKSGPWGLVDKKSTFIEIDNGLVSNSSQANTWAMLIQFSEANIWRWGEISLRPCPSVAKQINHHLGYGVNG